MNAIAPRHQRHSRLIAWTVAGLVLAPLLAARPAAADDEESPYGYLRTLEGTATLVAADTVEEPFVPSINQPILPGDQLDVSPGARAEVVLPEGSRVRVAGGTRLDFAVLGASGDDSGPRLTLESGELQLTVPSAAAGRATPRIDTENASIYAEGTAAFSIQALRVDSTRIQVREGAVEVLTPRGSTYVRAGESLSVDGLQSPRVATSQAGAWTALELWGQNLDEQFARARVPAEMAGNRAYDAAALEGHGDWVSVEGQYVWRPRVRVEWRPYTVGHWYYTPAGLTWVSNEPWGWVTYHYGSWDWSARHGWLWYPARRWAPAWVYWYWGPSYVGWCPTGLYSRHYGRRLHWGSYGWAGGPWRHYDHWNFVAVGNLRHRNLGRYVHRVARGTRPQGASLQLERGFITTETRGLARDAWNHPARAADQLARRAVRARSGASPASLPDVSSFVARQGPLDANLSRRVAARASAPRAVEVPAGSRRMAVARDVRAVQGTTGAVEARGVVPHRGTSTRADAPATAWRRGDRPTPGASTPPSGAGERIRVRPGSDATGSRSTTSTAPPREAPDRGAGVVRRAPEAASPGTGSEGRSTVRPHARDWRRPAVSGGTGTRSGTSAGSAAPARPPVRRVIDSVRSAPGTPQSDTDRSAPPAVRRAPDRSATSGAGAPSRSTSRGAAPRREVRSTAPSTVRPAAPREAPRRETRTTAPSIVRPSAPRSMPPRATAPRSAPSRSTSQQPAPQRQTQTTTPSRSTSARVRPSTQPPSRRTSPAPQSTPRASGSMRPPSQPSTTAPTPRSGSRQVTPSRRSGSTSSSDQSAGSRGSERSSSSSRSVRRRDG